MLTPCPPTCYVNTPLRTFGRPEHVLDMSGTLPTKVFIWYHFSLLLIDCGLLGAVGFTVVSNRALTRLELLLLLTNGG